MNVGQLKALLADQPDDMEVVVPGDDHSYWPAQASEVSALHKDWGPHNSDAPPYTQDSNEDPDNEEFVCEIYGKRVWVLLVSGP